MDSIVLNNLIPTIVLLFFALVLVKSTEYVSNSLRRLSQISKVGQFGITAFLLALATSLPELSVGVFAALRGDSSLSLGNVLGSNIANLSLVIGGAAVVSGSFSVVGNFLKRDLYLTFFAGSLPLLMLIDSKLTRLDGVILLASYVVFVVTVLHEKSKKVYLQDEPHEILYMRLFRFFGKSSVRRHATHLVVGAVGLLVSSNIIVMQAEHIARGFGVPILFIGLFLVSIGTTLPELAFEIRAIRERRVEMALGNLLGSIVANSTLVLGLVAVISPVHLDGGLRPYLYATLAFVVVFLVFWRFVSSKRRLEWWEGAILIILYFVFVLFESTRV